MLETSDSFILDKNPNLPTLGTYPYKGISVDLGLDASQSVPRIKVRRLIYPKSTYTFQDISLISKRLENCPICKEGKTIEEFRKGLIMSELTKTQKEPEILKMFEEERKAHADFTDEQIWKIVQDHLKYEGAPAMSAGNPTGNPDFRKTMMEKVELLTEKIKRGELLTTGEQIKLAKLLDALESKTASNPAGNPDLDDPRCKPALHGSNPKLIAGQELRVVEETPTTITFFKTTPCGAGYIGGESFTYPGGSVLGGFTTMSKEDSREIYVRTKRISLGEYQSYRFPTPEECNVYGRVHSELSSGSNEHPALHSAPLLEILKKVDEKNEYFGTLNGKLTFVHEGEPDKVPMTPDLLKIFSESETPFHTHRKGAHFHLPSDTDLQLMLEQRKGKPMIFASEKGIFEVDATNVKVSPLDIIHEREGLETKVTVETSKRNLPPTIENLRLVANELWGDYLNKIGVKMTPLGALGGGKIGELIGKAVEAHPAGAIAEKVAEKILGGNITKPYIRDSKNELSSELNSNITQSLNSPTPITETRRDDKMSMSKPFDEFLAGWANQAGISKEELSSIIMPQLFSDLLGIPVDIICTKLGGKFVKGIAGAGMMIGATFAKLDSRMTKDLLEFSSNWLGDVLDPSTDDLIALGRDTTKLKYGITKMNADALFQAFFKTPEQIKLGFEDAQRQFRPVFAEAEAFFAQAAASVQPAASQSPAPAQTYTAPLKQTYGRLEALIV